MHGGAGVGSCNNIGVWAQHCEQLVAQNLATMTCITQSLDSISLSAPDILAGHEQQVRHRHSMIMIRVVT